jgi:hypothetical protein
VVLTLGVTLFQIRPNPGTHAITAHVDIPDNQEKAVLEWFDTNSTALNDVLLLLSIFTGREVFIIDEDVYDPSDFGLTADPRIYQWGGIIRTSIPYKHKSTATMPPENAQFYEIIDTEEGEQWVPAEWPSDPSGYNIGFEEGLNEIYQLIRSEEWQQKYQGGYFLFLARSAFRRQILESSFLQCWAIWEHLFAVLNGNWLSPKAINQLPTLEKISFIMFTFILSEPINQKRLERLVEIRNRLIHFGRFPSRSTAQETESLRDDAELFIRLTETIIAKILGLQPSNIFNTREKLEDLLKP